MSKGNKKPCKPKPKFPRRSAYAPVFTNTWALLIFLKG